MNKSIEQQLIKNRNYIINNRLQLLSKQKFRVGFKLKDKDLETYNSKYEEMKEQITDIILKRLAPANPYKDGYQTPYKGHPVFVAQHATATCCRSCLEKWHKIEKGNEFTEKDLEYVVHVISKWLEKFRFCSVAEVDSEDIIKNKEYII
jgi:hypothetical protein